MLIDTHCHLDFPDFQQDFDAIMRRAEEAHVRQLITISTHVQRHKMYRALAEQYQHVFFSIGTHPHYAHEEADVEVETLVNLAQHPKCIALGETGLDYHYNKSPRDVAERVFRRHIEAARITDLPLVIHTRDADEDMIRILTDEMSHGPFRMLLHCFTGSSHLADVAIGLGAFISFSGVVTFKNSSELRDIAQNIPLESLLVETDSPFLAPVPYRGKRNEPSFIVETAKVLAHIKGVPFDELAEVLTRNTYRLFSKMKHVSESLHEG